MAKRFLRYGDRKYILNREAEARLERTVEQVYACGSGGHQWLTLYPDTEMPCRVLIVAGVPISVETELGPDD